MKIFWKKIKLFDVVYDIVVIYNIMFIMLRDEEIMLNWNC